MNTTAFRMLPAALGAAALLAAGAAVAAEMKVRVTNAAENPVTFTLEGKSRDIRSRKAATFTVTTLTPGYSLFFANGVGDRGQVDLSMAGAVVSAEDGLEYRCLTLGDDGMEMEFSEDCAKKVNKPK
jgi:hypothetical protein